MRKSLWVQAGQHTNTQASKKANKDSHTHTDTRTYTHTHTPDRAFRGRAAPRRPAASRHAHTQHTHTHRRTHLRVRGAATILPRTCTHKHKRTTPLERRPERPAACSAETNKQYLQTRCKHTKWMLTSPCEKVCGCKLVKHKHTSKQESKQRLAHTQTHAHTHTHSTSARANASTHCPNAGQKGRRRVAQKHTNSACKRDANTQSGC